MSANYEQVDTIRALLNKNRIDTTLKAKEDANNPLAPKGIIWFELWLKHPSDEDMAETVIEKYEFSQLKSSLKITWDALHTPPPAETNDGAPPAALRTTAAKEKRAKLMRAAYENWLPINNQKVFHRLASTLGFSDEEISANEFNKIRRPWNPDRLKSQVQALQQICKTSSTFKRLGDS